MTDFVIESSLARSQIRLSFKDLLKSEEFYFCSPESQITVPYNGLSFSNNFLSSPENFRNVSMWVKHDRFFWVSTIRENVGTIAKSLTKSVCTNIVNKWFEYLFHYCVKNACAKCLLTKCCELTCNRAGWRSEATDKLILFQPVDSCQCAGGGTLW